MSEGFSDPVVGGQGALIRSEIKSPNFSMAPQQGWAILKTGIAYFFDIVATGSITANSFDGTDFVINSNGAFFYNGTPANGNLILALASVAGVDGFGNSYGSGFTAGAPGNVEQIRFGVLGGSPLMFFLSAIGTALNNAALMLNISGIGSATYDTLVVKSSQDNTFNDYVAINLNGSSHDGTSQISSLADAYVDTSGTPHFYRSMSFNGNSITGTLTAITPGTGISRSNVATPETWHLATLGTGFTTSGSDQAPRYRAEGIAGGIARLDGTAAANATDVSGSTIFVLPVGYRPTTFRRRFASITNAAGYAAGGTSIMINTSGAVTTGLASASGNQFCMDGITFPLD